MVFNPSFISPQIWTVWKLISLQVKAIRMIHGTINEI